MLSSLTCIWMALLLLNPVLWFCTSAILTALCSWLSRLFVDMDVLTLQCFWTCGQILLWIDGMSASLTHTEGEHDIRALSFRRSIQGLQWRMSPCLEDLFHWNPSCFHYNFFFSKYFWKYVAWESTIVGITYLNLRLLTLRRHFGTQKRMCARINNITWASHPNIIKMTNNDTINCL